MSIESMEEPALKSTRIIGASCYLVMSLFSLTLNLLLLSIFIKTHKQLRTISFFILAWQLLICDLFGVFAQFILVIPQTFAGYSTHKQLRTISFFILAWQLLICDLFGVFAQFILVIPQTFAGYSLYSPTFSYAIGSLDTLSYNGAIMFAFLLTINRLCIFIFPAIDRAVFGSPKIYGFAEDEEVIEKMFDDADDK
ncbi:serpentine type 7TM GPCR chemoreceptor srx domain-containing protein [Ditylenchus destructor]|uniref:Serpentine type 7TM GPCR chemoreceptor srx domain-containing protein n=1 Tax=Ditylenchus destructor TaxID=166010 RepID=A0AAD4N0Z0_9BILA|nr:serpentine type 7TM GPCR chemoreceptor srx domain-containing protein [Ditylenchus destructor]